MTKAPERRFSHLKWEVFPNYNDPALTEPFHGSCFWPSCDNTVFIPEGTKNSSENRDAMYPWTFIIMDGYETSLSCPDHYWKPIPKDEPLEEE